MTSVRTVIIDPNGDTILKLKSPRYKLEEWRDPKTTTNQSTDESRTKDCDRQFDTDDSIDASTKEIHFRVSSNALRIVSSYFENMFKLGFCESVKDEEEGKFSISAEDFNPIALEHILNIAHCQTKRVPHALSLEMLVQVAVVVDYYNLHEAISMYSNTWIERTQATEKMPEDCYCKETVMWLCIGKVFSKHEIFSEMCSNILGLGSEPCQDLGLPLQPVIETLDGHRCEVIENSISRLNDLALRLQNQKTYERADLTCSWVCRTAAFGALTLYLYDHGLLQSHSAGLLIPYVGLSADGMWSLCSSLGDSGMGMSPCKRYKCTLRNLLQPITQDLADAREDRLKTCLNGFQVQEKE